MSGTNSFAVDDAVVLFITLVALYSPAAALSSYLPIIARFSAKDQLRLAIALFVNVLVIAFVAIWIGELLLEKVLGLSTDSLVVTGGIALIFEGIHLMTGPEEQFIAKEPEEVQADPETGGWRSVAFMPITFPLTIGGTTFGILVAFRADVGSVHGAIGLSVAAALYALVTGVTIYAAGHVARRSSQKMQIVLGRLAGILLTAIAVTLLISGGTRMVHSVLQSLGN
ncbi:multiple antibiotic resistance protein [Jatrophihabitans sp. GAS493]|uniref:MarC family protein n=1 Tax=Jatrophihabitans sp. GAS493 TaxID=1907575 RepID=UPI000BB6D924|nr:MarC family protein [Jatrophihabitans sp. GAS493]SOD71494.1 multiple antibiotic resistance protein [Jatrophihabitans sp. GAS493]